MFGRTFTLSLTLVGLALPARAADPPAVTISLGSRQAAATPQRTGFTHTGGGNIDVAQPAPDTLVVTMTGVAVAGGHPCKHSHALLTFTLNQCFDVVFEKPEVKRARLTVEGRVIGLLRSHGKGGGSAEEGPGQAVVSSGPAVIATLSLPPHAVSGGENLSINDRCGPVAASVAAGTFTLSQTWTVSATRPHSLKLCKAASAEIAPDPALDPLWISYWEPFKGAAKKDFGFQVIVKVAPDTEAIGGAGQR